MEITKLTNVRASQKGLPLCFKTFMCIALGLWGGGGSLLVKDIERQFCQRGMWFLETLMGRPPG